MPLYHFTTTTHLHPSPLQHLHFTTTCRSSSSSFRPIPKSKPKPKPNSPSPPTHHSNQPLPARDRIIDFGRHKGKRLGSLPSSYLRWASDNLRCRDTVEWAKLADEVLTDPIYNDRVEWEHAHRILSGDGICENLYASVPNEDVFDIADRFGWDFPNDDTWRKIDFELLGTSFGGRIPRKNAKKGNGSRIEDRKELVQSGRDGEEEETYRYIVVDEKGNRMDQMEMVRGKRADRRNRRRGKREEELRMKRLEQIKLVREEIGGMEKEEEEEEGLKINDREKGEVEGGHQVPARLFPGRGALLDKIEKRSGR